MSPASDKASYNLRTSQIGKTTSFNRDSVPIITKQ